MSTTEISVTVQHRAASPSQGVGDGAGLIIVGIVLPGGKIVELQQSLARTSDEIELRRHLAGLVAAALEG